MNRCPSLLPKEVNKFRVSWPPQISVQGLTWIESWGWSSDCTHFIEGEGICLLAMSRQESDLEASLMFICCAWFSSNPSVQRTGEIPMHVRNKGRDITVLIKHWLCACFQMNFLPLDAHMRVGLLSCTSACTDAVILARPLPMAVCLCTSRSAKWHSDLGMAFPFGMLTEIGSLADTLSVSLAKFRS